MVQASPSVDHHRSGTIYLWVDLHSSGEGIGNAGLREARRLLPGAPIRPGQQGSEGGPPPLRLQGPGDPRGLCGHDRERQDRAMHLIAGGGRPGRRTGHHHRPQGGHGQPHADVPGAAQGGLPALGERGGRPEERPLPGGLCRQAGRHLEERPGRLGRGRGPHPAPARCRRHDHLHSRAAVLEPRSRSSSPSPPLRWRSSATRSC